MRAVADAAGDRMLLAEIACDRQVERMAEYSAPGRLHTAYSFELLGPGPDGTRIADAVTPPAPGTAGPPGHCPTMTWRGWPPGGALTAIPAGSASSRPFCCRLRGTVILYQGEELGLSHSDVPRERLQDPEAIRFWPNHRGRDGARTPMPWDDRGPAGLLPPGRLASGRAVACRPQRGAAGGDPGSHLAHCRHLLALRRDVPALRVGSFDVVSAARDHLVFRRVHQGPDGESTFCAPSTSAGPRCPATATARPLPGQVRSGQLDPDGYVILREQG
jgi:alpha-glucosidase